VDVERRPEHRLIACATRPRGVAATVPEARLVTDEHLAGSEGVAVGAAGRREDDPLPGSGANQISDSGHDAQGRRTSRPATQTGSWASSSCRTSSPSYSLRRSSVIFRTCQFSP
jgi:hypothetical protein